MIHETIPSHQVFLRHPFCLVSSISLDIHSWSQSLSSLHSPTIAEKRGKWLYICLQLRPAHLPNCLRQHLYTVRQSQSELKDKHTSTVWRQFILQLIQCVGVVFFLLLLVTGCIIVRQILAIDNCDSTNSKIIQCLSAYSSTAAHKCQNIDLCQNTDPLVVCCCRLWGRRHLACKFHAPTILKIVGNPA